MRRPLWRKVISCIMPSKQWERKGRALGLYGMWYRRSALEDNRNYSSFLKEQGGR